MRENTAAGDIKQYFLQLFCNECTQRTHIHYVSYLSSSPRCQSHICQRGREQSHPGWIWSGKETKSTQRSYKPESQRQPQNMYCADNHSYIYNIVILGVKWGGLDGELYLRWKVAVSTMILLDREKDSAVNNTRSGRYRGLKNRRMVRKKKGTMVTNILTFFFF